MEIIILIALVAIGLVIYFNYARRDVPSDVVQLNKIEEDVGIAPFKAEAPVPAADIVPQPVVVEGAGTVDVKPVITEVVETGKVLDKPKRKPAARTAAPRKTAAKKTAAPKKTTKKKSA